MALEFDESCPTCGSKLEALHGAEMRRCRGCRRLNPVGFTYCGYCATPIEELPTPGRVPEAVLPAGRWPNLTSSEVDALVDEVLAEGSSLEAAAAARADAAAQAIAEVAPRPLVPPPPQPVAPPPPQARAKTIAEHVAEAVAEAEAEEEAAETISQGRIDALFASFDEAEDDDNAGADPLEDALTLPPVGARAVMPPSVDTGAQTRVGAAPTKPKASPKGFSKPMAPRVTPAQPKLATTTQYRPKSKNTKQPRSGRTIAVKSLQPARPWTTEEAAAAKLAAIETPTPAAAPKDDVPRKAPTVKLSPAAAKRLPARTIRAEHVPLPPLQDNDVSGEIDASTASAPTSTKRGRGKGKGKGKRRHQKRASRTSQSQKVVSSEQPNRPRQPSAERPVGRSFGAGVLSRYGR